MTTQIKINEKFSVEINISSDSVLVVTTFFGTTRKVSYDSITDAIENTTIVPVKNYLLSI